MFFRIVHTILFYLLVILGFFAGALFAVPSKLFSRRSPRAFQAIAHYWGLYLVTASGIKVSRAGLENIPRNKAVIYAVNHQGAADILIALAYLPSGFRFAIKKELFKVPFFGWYLRNAGYFYVDRQRFRSAYEVVDEIVDGLKAGDSVLIFPEGTRTQTGELGRFKRGSLLAALKSGAPIVPVAISGSYNILPRHGWLINLCPVKFTVGAPIEIKTEADYENKVEAVRQAIADML